MITLGICIPGGSFMPQGDKNVSSPAEIMAGGYDIARRAGFDYAEITCGLVAALGEGDIEALVSDGVKFYASNSFISLPVVTTAAAELREYVEKVIGRLARLGVRRCVFGSGRARSIPDGVSRTLGEEKLCDFIRMCAAVAAKYEMQFVLEPLNRDETNFMNTLADGADIIKKLALPNLKLLCDAYHMYKNGEDTAEIVRFAPFLTHAHISEGDRSIPGTAGDGYLERVADALYRSGYDGGVSCECSYRDFPSDAPEICRYMRKTLIERYES